MELLAPAGDLEKLKIAILYGADAVYFGGEGFSLRAGAGNLSIPEIQEGVAFAHERGKKCYMALNIFAHNQDIAPLQAYLTQLRDIPIDAFIISDPGVMDLVREVLPQAEIHLSTQANMTNWATGNFWHRMGVSRLVLARELSLLEIQQIREHLPAEMELEAFVHGAMCISYSGRCLLSNVMTGRDANQGACSHPCRWQYALVEEQRPGVYYPVEEDDRGTYVMNSRDLCMVDRIPELARAGITSFKIEGRMKSIFYVATVVCAYRKALDQWLHGEDPESVDPTWRETVSTVSNRGFTTGFYDHKPDASDQNYLTSDYDRTYLFVGVVEAYDAVQGRMLVQQRNKICLGDALELFGPNTQPYGLSVTAMWDAKTGEALESAPHAQQRIWMPAERPVEPYSLLRKRRPSV